MLRDNKEEEAGCSHDLETREGKISVVRWLSDQRGKGVTWLTDKIE